MIPSDALLGKKSPHVLLLDDKSIDGIQTTNHTAYFVAMTTRYDVVFYLRLLRGKINC